MAAEPFRSRFLGFSADRFPTSARVATDAFWTADLTPDVTRRDPGASFAEGTWLVKAEVVAGTWSSTGGTTCFWERLSGFGGEPSDVIDSGTSRTVTITSADLGFRSRRCGTWSRTG